MSFFLVGAGSPLVDYTAEVDELFLQEFVPGCKGGTLNIDDAGRSRIFAALKNQILRTPGGAAANTVCALGRLGVRTAFFGKTGVDEDGEYFRCELKNSGVSPDFLLSSPGPTGYCLSLVTPDAERTMRSNLGVSVQISADDIAGCCWQKCRWLLTEGYMLAIPGFEKIFGSAKSAGCCTALDLSSIEIARNSRDTLPELLEKSIDLLFCNADEAAALTGTDDPERNVEYLSTLCGMTALKLGAAGSLVKRRNEPAFRVEPYSFGAAVDTTAAGDHYAAGFFYGLAKGETPDKCGFYGSVLGGAAAAVPGSRIPESIWNRIVEIIK